MADHHHSAAHAHRGRLVGALVITFAVMIVQAVGGIASGSVALLADAGHMLSDSFALAMALFATWLGTRPPSDTRTFGWQRVEVLAAAVNGLVVAVIGVTVIVEGIRRIGAPGSIDTGVMLAAAGLGLVANLIAMRLLMPGSRESLNIRGAYLEVLGDMLGSVAVIVSGVVIATTGWLPADGVASIAIGILILPRAVSLLRDVAHVLLEGTPTDVDLTEVRQHLLGLPGVVGVHDLHAWTITSGVPVLTVHVETTAMDQATHAAVLGDLQACISQHFDVAHSTIQIEGPGHRDHESSIHD